MDVKKRHIRSLLKFASPSKVRQEMAHRTGVYTPVHEDSSTVSQKQFADEVAFHKRSIIVEGPVLLLLGPIGEFFSRFAKFLLKQNVETYKISFPYKEFFIPRKIIHRFNQPLDKYRPFIKHFLIKYKIKQIYMSGDFSSIHQIAIEEANKLNIKAYVFELGYIRPNYITLEENQVNARSNLNKPASFYHTLPDKGPVIEKPEKKPFLWRKYILPFCFIQQTFTDFDIIPGEHKSNPKPIFLYYQCLGSLRYYLYKLTERKINKHIENIKHFFLVPLQVDSDSQITLSSKYTGMEAFIEEVITSFAHHAPHHFSLVFKHHPADRGYNNYKKFICHLGEIFAIQHRLYYVHDANLNTLFKKTTGLVTINSTVGLDAIKNNVPTVVMGETFYKMEGLSAKVPLDDFWTHQYTIDRTLFNKFYRYLIETTQLKGSFHSPFNFKQYFVIDNLGSG